MTVYSKVIMLSTIPIPPGTGERLPIIWPNVKTIIIERKFKWPPNAKNKKYAVKKFPAQNKIPNKTPMKKVFLFFKIFSKDP